MSSDAEREFRLCRFATPILLRAATPGVLRDLLTHQGLSETATLHLVDAWHSGAAAFGTVTLVEAGVLEPVAIWDDPL